MALKIIFMGTPNFAVPILKSVNVSKHKILEVYTQPPSKKNRGLKIQNSPIHDFANKLNIPLLYISTAGIFDGKKDLYDDWNLPNPLGVYARSKYMGERFVCENANRYIICRAGWMMGAGPKKDKKFIQKLMKQLKT